MFACPAPGYLSILLYNKFDVAKSRDHIATIKLIPLSYSGGPAQCSSSVTSQDRSLLTTIQHSIMSHNLGLCIIICEHLNLHLVSPRLNRYMNRYCLNRFRRYPWTKNCSLLIPSKFLSKFVTNSAMITTTPGHVTRKRRKPGPDQRCGGKRWKFVSMLKDQGWREWRGRVEAWHSYNFLRGFCPQYQHCPLSVSGDRTENVYMFTATLNSTGTFSKDFFSQGAVI